MAFIFVIVFLVVFVILNLLIPQPEIVCRDGWESSSIGIQGACSHHGGVNSAPSDLVFFIKGLVSYFITVYLSELIRDYQERKEDAKREAALKKHLNLIQAHSALNVTV